MTGNTVLALPADDAATATAPATTHLAAIRAGTTLHVEGMTCAYCAVAIRPALGKLDGVLSTEVDVEGEKATVTYDPAKVTPDAIAKEVRDLGYPATVQG